MLYRMNIAYSAKKWTLIFAEIDRNYDGFVSSITFFVALSVAFVVRIVSLSSRRISADIRG